MKNNPSNEIARRYELAYHKVLNDLPYWKRDVIVNHNRDIDDRVIQEFLIAVADLAESNKIIPTQMVHGE